MGYTYLVGLGVLTNRFFRRKHKSFFKNFFAPLSLRNDPFEVEEIPKLSEDMARSLSQPVSKEEVWMALNDMHPYKSLGPDGFKGVFFRQYRHIIGEDIYSLVSQAFEIGFFYPRLAETLIALIPKVHYPTTF